jgi:ATP-dependent Lhr-like helicase
MAESQGFNRLHKGVQRWVWAQNWSSLCDIQEQAIEPVLNADCDLIISASTAAGKTEAAFLPACSRIAEQEETGFDGYKGRSSFYHLKTKPCQAKFFSCSAKPA